MTTTPGPRVAPSAERAVMSPVRADRTRALVLTALVLVVVLQRFAVPVAGLSVPVVLLVGLGLTAALLLSGSAHWDRSRVELYAVAAASCTAVALVATTAAPAGSATSLVLLLVVYVPWLVRADQRLAALGAEVAGAFVTLLLVLSVVGVVQLLAQYAGLWTSTDVLREAVPEQYLIGGFNSVNPLAYGSPLVKSTAFVFLEPSFFSQTCALAVLVAVTRRAPVWKLVVLGAGLASAVSGTGLVLLGAGAVVLLVRAPHLVHRAQVLTALVLAAAVALTPLGALLLARSTETSQRGSSGYLRFVQPYTEVAAGLEDDRLRYLVGAGPGTVERLLSSLRDGPLGEAVVYGIVPKLVFEYGLVAGAVFVLFILVVLAERSRSRVLPAISVLLLFVLSGSLLQPHTLYLVWLLGPLWARAPGDRVPAGALWGATPTGIAPAAPAPPLR